ncbi:hypothetical protein BKA70DRAFT_1306975 [Coprinopsis sp. MPI-PUGE-AT-0042]|nr:hypothetical protein BKA70DRAFT_1306975 [Coprinopsis sp. MPI-PUGE-AT-0042]
MLRPAQMLSNLLGMVIAAETSQSVIAEREDLWNAPGTYLGYDQMTLISALPGWRKAIVHEAIELCPSANTAVVHAFSSCSFRKLGRLSKMRSGADKRLT